MSALTALFIGGNGIISSACSALAVERGIDLTLLNRGTDSTRPAIDGVKHIVGDADDLASAKLGEYDVVVNFRSFLPSAVAKDIALFGSRTAQYVYISSASAYQKPVSRLPITESTPLRNPWWQYSRDKIASEDLLVAAYREDGFPATIVRPSHTYDRTLIPLAGGWTQLDRMRRGEPVLVHGDGTSLWTLTHNTDFAKAFVGLLGNPRAVGDVFQITSDEVHTWDAIARLFGDALGVEPEIVHVASDTIARTIPEWGPELWGDKAHSVVFDNSKVRALVPEYVATTPFWKGAREIVDWHLASPERQVVDTKLNAQLDSLITAARG
jgi:nucleoside-diphosphate-sugar epimerase